MFDVKTLERNALAAARADEEHRGAIAKERAAAEEFLVQLAAAVRPALPAVSSRPPGIEEATWRGVKVGRGGLYLREDGAWGIFAPSLDNGWDEGLRVLSASEVVLLGYRAPEIARELDRAVKAQLVGNKARKTAEAERAAETLRSVAALLATR